MSQLFVLPFHAFCQNRTKQRRFFEPYIVWTCAFVIRRHTVRSALSLRRKSFSPLFLSRKQVAFVCTPSFVSLAACACACICISQQQVSKHRIFAKSINTSDFLKKKKSPGMQFIRQTIFDELRTKLYSE